MPPCRVAASAAPLLTAAVTLLLTGCGDASPRSTLTPDQIQTRLYDIAEKFNAGVDAGRDVSPLAARVDSVLTQAPDHVEALTLRGQIATALDDLHAARRFFNQALAHQPENAPLHLLAGGIAEQQRDYPDAEAHFRAAVAARPRHAASRTRLAHAVLRQGRLEEARALLDQALSLNVMAHRAHALRGAIALEEQDPGLALIEYEQAYRKALDEEPEAQLAYAVTLSGLLMNADRPADAARVLRVADLSDFFTADVMARHAEALAAAGEPGIAADYYDQWSRRDPTNPLPVAEAVRWFMRADQPRRARSLLERLRHIAPRDPRISVLDAQLRDAPG